MSEKNAEIKQQYEEYILKHRGNLYEFDEMVNYYRNKYNIEIDVIPFNSGETNVRYNGIDTLYNLMQRKRNNNYETPYDGDDSYELLASNDMYECDETLEEMLLEGTVDKPKGILACIVNDDGGIQHIISFVIGKDKSGKQFLLCADNSLTLQQEFKDKDHGLLLAAILMCNHSFNSTPTEKFIMDCIEENYQKLQKKYKTVHFKTRLSQIDEICFILSTMFCKVLLKNDGEEFYKIVNSKDKEVILPLAITKYTQVLEKGNKDYISKFHKLYENTEKNKKHFKELENAIYEKEKNSSSIVPSFAFDTDYITRNILAMKKLFKYLDKKNKKCENKKNITNKICNNVESISKNTTKNKNTVENIIKKKNIFKPTNIENYHEALDITEAYNEQVSKKCHWKHGNIDKTIFDLKNQKKNNNIKK